MKKQEPMNVLKDLDTRLNGPAQNRVRDLVSALPEEPLSMAWRSDLNEKLLRKHRAEARRKQVLWFLSPALGFGVAAAMTMVVFMHGSPRQGVVRTQPPLVASRAGDAGLANALVSTHQEVGSLSEAAGVGLSPNEAVSLADNHSDSDSWTEADVDGF